jgi:HPt (histidine-containing phosphotransfer) domain-containing protein
MTETTPYDAILMDVNMPVMDGFTATRTLRERGLKTPIVALTANAMRGFEQRCLDAGYSGYISKPVDIEELMSRMAELLGGERVQEAPEPDATAGPEKEEAEGASPAEWTPIVSRLPMSNRKCRELVLRFADRLQEKLPEMEAAAQSGNYPVVAELAHWLKGTGGTVGFDEFTEPAQELENWARQAKAAEVQQGIAHLREMNLRLVVDRDGPPNGEAEKGRAASAVKTETTGSRLEASIEKNTVKPVTSRLASYPKLRRPILQFIDKLEGRIGEMEKACGSGDMEALASLAHWLKGAGGTVGYDDFTEPAAQLEDIARKGDRENAGAALETVTGLAKAVVPPEDDGHTGTVGASFNNNGLDDGHRMVANEING